METYPPVLDWASGTLGPEQNERETPPVTLIHILFSLRVKKKKERKREERGKRRHRGNERMASGWSVDDGALVAAAMADRGAA